MSYLLLDDEMSLVDSRSLTKEDLLEAEKHIALVKAKNKLNQAKGHSTVHVISRGSNWAVHRSGSKRAHRVVRSKTQAIVIAKRLKGNTEIIIHTKSGQIDKRILIS